MSKLSKGMIDHLNEVITTKNVGFHYELSDTETYAPKATIVVNDNMGWVVNSIINCTDDYYEWLRLWFKNNYDVEIVFNNTGSIFWSNDYND
jgi:hypothetical protein